MRTQLKTLVVCFMTALTTLSALAQIQKGSYSLGGDIGVNAYLQRGKVYDITNFNALVSPSVGKFLTDKWLVGVRPILSTTISNATFSQVGSSSRRDEFKNNVTRLGLELSSRYYLATNGNVKAFAFAKASYDRALTYSYYRLASGSSTDEATINGNFLNYQAGLGGNYFLKPDVALEATLAYGHTETPYAYGILQTGRVLAAENYMLNIKMNNFIGTFAQADKNAPPQYIRKGRQTIGGTISFLRTKQENKTAQTFVQVNPQFSHFVTNKLRLMGDINWLKQLDSDNKSPLIATVAARYYIHAKNRFFVYPELSVSHNFVDDASYQNAFSLGIGGSYFLTENVALEATFLQTQLYSRGNSSYEPQTFVHILGLGNVGLTYFIR